MRSLRGLRQARGAAKAVLDITDQNSMQTIASLKLRCIACGSRRVECSIPNSEQEAMAFLVGH